MRPSKDETMLRVAEVFSMRSTCERARVGCVITNWDYTQVVAIGYNGNARGLANGCDTRIPGACGCIHAEVNALLKAPYDPGQRLRLYSTTAPCPNCAKLIINSMVRQVYFRRAYRTTAGVELLAQAQIQCTIIMDGLPHVNDRIPEGT